MGAAGSTTERLDRLTALGFTVAEARLALDAANGNVERAEQLLLAKRRREQSAGNGLAQRINTVLREQRPWPEFFERFLMPEHWAERVATNLLYYQANYIILSLGVTVVSVLLNPALLLLAVGVGVLFGGALVWDGDARSAGVATPLTLQQRLGGAGLGAALLVNSSGQTSSICRIALICGGLVIAHASFRARSLKARWAFFQEEIKVD